MSEQFPSAKNWVLQQPTTFNVRDWIILFQTKFTNGECRWRIIGLKNCQEDSNSYPWNSCFLSPGITALVWLHLVPSYGILLVVCTEVESAGHCCIPFFLKIDFTNSSNEKNFRLYSLPYDTTNECRVERKATGFTEH